MLFIGLFIIPSFEFCNQTKGLLYLSYPFIELLFSVRLTSLPSWFLPAVSMVLLLLSNILSVVSHIYKVKRETLLYNGGVA